MRSVLVVCLILQFSFIYAATSVSGISSGGYAAVQYHVAFSSSLIGAGIIAAGPYYCAQGNAEIALTACMKDPSDIDITVLTGETDYAYEMDTIDDPSNLKGQKVWLFSGTADSVVAQGVVEKLDEYYNHYSAEITKVFNIPAEHSFVTNDYGNQCSYLGDPYINNCNLDSAGALLQNIHGNLNPPVSPISSNILSIDQSEYIPPGYDTETAGLQATAYYYLPSYCTNSQNCSVHIALHGCNQTVDVIGNTFYINTGYNGWGEANNIIILYPQARANSLNPYGCFDWWGYTGVDYCTQEAPQMAAINGMVKHLYSKYSNLYF